MEAPPDFKAQQESIQKALVSTVKSVNRIAAEDLGFQRTVNPDVAEQLDDRSARMLHLSTRLLQSAAKACGVKGPRLEDAEDIDMRWQAIVDVVDSVLEKADTAMDEYTGLVKRKEPPSADTGPKAKRTKPTGKVIRNANVTKPQTTFEKQPDNFPTGPWKPILANKPHATVSLEQSLVNSPGEDGIKQYKHPYETEISNMKYPDWIFQKHPPVPSQPVDSTKATWVDTYEGVLEMLEELKKAKEIAVDLEHHDFRTYTGLVCLMQVSTRDKDWIVDTLRPWRHRLEILNDVFADPSIVKVFHGAYMDMVWLQRDLGLYVNGLFDTYFACDLLGYPGRSLAFLLSKFVDFDADKQYQLADWRIRPIPEEMLYYARSDTHYLLYIFDNVRNELIEASDRSDPEKDYINQVLERSRELALSRHENPDYNETTGEGPRGWYNYVLKHSHLALNGEQFSIFKALWKWRDETARQEDESPNFVLGTTNVTEIARVNPPDVKALHSLLPLTAPLARARLNDIWDRLQEAKTKGGPSLMQFFTNLMPESRVTSKMPKLARQRVELPTLEGPDVSVVTLVQSKLFGSMPISSRWEESRGSSTPMDDNIPFPWQRFVRDSTTTDGVQEEEAVSQVVENIPSASETPNVKAGVEEPDEEFTLKTGRKRKLESEPDEDDETSSSGESEFESKSESESEPQPQPEPPANEEEDMSVADASGVISMVDDSSEKSKKQRQLERRQRRKQGNVEIAKKREAKVARKAKKQERRQGKEEQKKKYSAVPFDYAKATSVMHANRGQGSQSGRKEQKKVFDPYSKTGEDEIKGARKMPPVRGERSATFKK
ncbi:exosome complex exonuclease Rrp [Metarhizium album ARSEF 1941]|uniref:Exosome complex exonuclease Rrp n=1 Tax=Metarhizium album (strain ARSEF 1941) TaxID=1081103 RepID=A0A0B2WMA7_METAS|nr:exosome complex exonuclease Rrp [Metarhizium album ARSEF 1941]KHN97186.1 exosome complex exonuclease Rrp [Metarhizium album ARSEF 1941]